MYLGAFDFKPDETMPPTKDVDRIMRLDTKVRLCQHLIQRGVSTMSARFFVLSCVHTIEDIDQTIKALSDSLDTMIAEGTISQTKLG